MYHVVYISPTKLLLSASDQMKDFSVEGVLDFKKGACQEDSCPYWRWIRNWKGFTRKTFIGVYSVNPTILKKRKKMSGTIKVKETKEETSFHSLGIWFQKGIEVPSNRRILQTKVDGNGKVDNKGWEWKY